MKIFYSWQSDSPAKTNRNLIEQAINTAIKRIKADWVFNLEPAIDRDTRNLPGTPAISDSIFEKIRECDVFIADVTIVSSAKAKRPIPNPNVLIELGYAASEIGWDRIICVANTAYGSVEAMPFDLRHRRILPYELTDEKGIISEERDKLTNSIQLAIKALQPRITPEVEYLSHLFHRVTTPLRVHICVLIWAYQHIEKGTSEEDFLYILLRRLAKSARSISGDELTSILIEKSSAFTLSQKHRWRKVIDLTKEIGIRVNSFMMEADKWGESQRGFYESGAIEWLAKFYEQKWLPAVEAADHKFSIAGALDSYLNPKQSSAEEEKKIRDKIYELNGSAFGTRDEYDKFFDSTEAKTELKEIEQTIAHSTILMAYPDKKLGAHVWKLIELIKQDLQSESGD